MEVEIWKDIPDYKGVYQASNTGKIRSLDTYIEFVRMGIKSRRFQAGRILRGGVNKKGYLTVSPVLNSKCTPRRIHRLVAITFIDNPENKPEVNHINGIKTDNRIDNLEWATGSENVRHAVNKGLVKRVFGEKHHNSKLNKECVDNIRLRYKSEHVTLNQLSVEYNVSITTISNIINNLIWKFKTEKKCQN